MSILPEVPFPGRPLIFALLRSRPTSASELLLLRLFCGILVVYTCVTTWRTVVSKTRKRKLSLKYGCQSPVLYPHRALLFGLDLLSILAKALRQHTYLSTTQRLLKQFGDTVEYQILGNTAVITIDPENIRTVLARNFEHYSLGRKRKSDLQPLFGNGIFNSDGAVWEHSRGMLRSHFSRDQIANFDIYERHLQQLIEIIPRDHRTVDLQAMFFNLAMDIATDIFFGQSTNILNKELSTSEHSKFAEAFSYSQKTLTGFSDLDLVSILGQFLPNPTLQTQIKVVNTYIDAFVKTALDSLVSRDGENSIKGKTGPERHVFLHELVKETTDPVRLRSELLNLLVAGRDTTATLLANTWFILARRRDVWNKLRAEIEQLQGQPPTYSHIKSMRYLSYVIKESLRLLPPVPINHRTAEMDTVLPHGGGSDGKAPIFIAKGTLVAYSVYAMHRRTDLYGCDAEYFRPERWDELKPGWAYLPFHGGPRTCLGQHLAVTEVSYIVVRLMQTFDKVESRDPTPWEESLGINCCSRNGVKVALW